MFRSAEDGAGGRGALNGEPGERSWERGAFVILFGLGLLLSPLSSLLSQERLDRGRFTFQFSPGDRQLATSLAAQAVTNDTFPGLPRPVQRVVIAIAPDARAFRDWAGDAAPEWGSALAFPASRRILLQGRNAGSDAGDPLAVLRHEIAHLALHEVLGDAPPRWFDEGYAAFAAGEFGRQEVLATNLALALAGVPTLDELDESFLGGATAAQSAYALAYSAVADLAAAGGDRGLTLFFGYWRSSGSLERAMRQAYGMTRADFERGWRQRTRRRYGVLAVVSNIALAGVLIAFVLTPFYLARRRRDRRKLETMRAADAAAEAAEKAALDNLIGGP